MHSEEHLKVTSVGHGDQPEVIVESLDSPGAPSRRTSMPLSDASALRVGDIVVVKNYTVSSALVQRDANGEQFLLYGDKRWW